MDNNLNRQFPSTIKRNKTTFTIRRGFQKNQDLLTTARNLITKAQSHEKPHI